MPTFRSLVLHVAIAAVATIMVAAAAVAIGLSGAHSIGGQLDSDAATRVASGDWPKELTPVAPASVPSAGTHRANID